MKEAKKKSATFIAILNFLVLDYVSSLLPIVFVFVKIPSHSSFFRLS